MAEINVLNIVYKMTFGGAEKVLADLINGSDNRFHHVICSLTPHDDFVDQIREEKRFIIDLLKTQGNDWKIPIAISKIIRKEKIDIVHCQNWGTYLEGYLGARLQVKMPKFVFAVHGKIASDLEGVPQRRILMQRFLSNRIDGIITPSFDLKEDYARTIGVSSSIIDVIYNGVDINVFKPANDSCESKKRFGFLPSHTVIGCVARFDRIKNIPSLIKGFAFCHSKFPETRLLLVGDGEEMEQIRRLIRQLDLEDVVSLPGKRQDVHRCLRALDIYIQPSHYECMPVTILEAMSSGLAVIAPRVGGIPEIIVDDYNGILLDYPGPEAIASALARLVVNQDMRCRYAINNRDLIERKFSLKSMVQAYERYFDSIIN
jgi:sugar transferase (PEP-CTERM/EpsH1 system associated)